MARGRAIYRMPAVDQRRLRRRPDFFAYVPVAYSELAREVSIAVTVSETDVMSRPISELTDDFPGTTLDSAKWTTSGTPATVSGGVGHLNPPAVSDYVSILSVNEYNVFGSSYFAEFVPLPVNSPGASNQSGISLRHDANNTIEFGLWGVNLGYILTGTLPSDNDSGFVAYNPTDHRWLRIRADATTLYFDTSPDGGTWTQRFSHAMVSYGVGAINAGAFAGWWDAGDSDSGEATIDKVNIPGPQVYNETNRLVTIPVTVGGAAMLSPRKLHYDFTSGIGNWHTGGPNQSATHDTTTPWATNTMKLRKTDFTGGVESIRADDGVQPTLDWRPFGRTIQFWGWAGVKARMRIEIYNGTIDVVGPWTDLQDATWTPIQSTFNDSDLATAQHFSLVVENTSGVGGDLSFWVDTIEQGTILAPDSMRMIEAHTVTVPVTVTAPSSQAMKELGREVTFSTTVTAPTETQKHNELNRTVTAAVTVTATDQLISSGQEHVTVTIPVTVTRTDIQAMVEHDQLVSIAGTVTKTDIQHHQELVRLVSIAATVTATATQAHKELTRLVTTAVTVTKTDVQVHKELVRLSTTTVTVTATDSLYSSAQEFRTVTLAVTVTTQAFQGHKEPDRLVLAAVTVTAQSIQHNADLARPVLVATTVSATDLQRMAEARAVAILVSVLATDFYRPLEPVGPWHQPAGTITSARPNGNVNSVGGGATISDVIPDTTITDRRG